MKLADKTPRSRVAVTRGVCRPVYLRVPHSLSTWMYGEIALPAHEGAGADVGGDERASHSRQTDPVRAQGASRGRSITNSPSGQKGRKRNRARLPITSAPPSAWTVALLTQRVATARERCSEVHVRGA